MKRNFISLVNNTPSPLKSGMLGSAKEQSVLDQEALQSKKQLEKIVKHGVIGQTITKDQLKDYGEKHDKEFEESKRFSAY